MGAALSLSGQLRSLSDKLENELDDLSLPLRETVEEHIDTLRHIGGLVSQQEEELDSHEEENDNLRRWLAAANAHIGMLEDKSAAERHRSAQEIGHLRRRLAAAEARIEADKEQADAKDRELASLREEVARLQRQAPAQPALDARLANTHFETGRTATEQNHGPSHVNRQLVDVPESVLGTPAHSSGWSYSMDLPVRLPSSRIARRCLTFALLPVLQQRPSLRIPAVHPASTGHNYRRLPAYPLGTHDFPSATPSVLALLPVVVARSLRFADLEVVRFETCHSEG
ncbi:hypothetical protein BJY59DRAFT_695105 [Rhodotorula toruloides]